MRLGVLGSTLLGWDVNSAGADGPCRCCGGKLANHHCRSASELVTNSDCLFLSSPWDVTQSILEGLDLGGKLLLDHTQRSSGRFDGCDDASGAECVARWAKGARVVKVSHTPPEPGEGSRMFVCGEDVVAKSEACEILAGLGFETVDAGPLSQSRWLERFASLWNSRGRQPLPLGLCESCGLPFGLGQRVTTKR